MIKDFIFLLMAIWAISTLSDMRDAFVGDPKPEPKAETKDYTRKF